MGRLLGVVVGVVLVGVVGLAGCIGLMADGTDPTNGADTTPSALAVTATAEALDQAAVAAQCPGLAWSVLAAVTFVAGTPAFADANANVAEDTPDVLCASGGGQTAGLPGALEASDHAPGFSEAVLVLAAALAVDQNLDTVSAGAIVFAAAALGTPYRWGGTGEGSFDCSGLVQAAFGAAGLKLPRVAQDQFDFGPIVAPGATVAPGDLVFFGPSVASVNHVGLAIGQGLMIDAPHTGAVVRIESTRWSDYLSATAPG